MKNLKSYYLWIVVALVVAGVLTEYWSSNFSYQTAVMKTFDPNGVATSVVTITKPGTATLLSIVSEFLFGLGGSVLVSVFVLRRIEDVLMEDKQRELEALHTAINVNVFDSLFKTMMPEEIYHVFKRDILGAGVLRKNADWIYDFDVQPTGGICLKQTIKYELHNLRREKVTETFTAQFDCAGGIAGVQKMICMSRGTPIINYARPEMPEQPPEKIEISEQCDGKVVVTRRSDGSTELATSVDIDALHYIDVTMVYVTHYEGQLVNDGYFSRYPMINAKLTANFPIGYDFSLFQAMSTELVLTLQEEGRAIYEAKGGILPQQGFIFRLQKKLSA